MSAEVIKTINYLDTLIRRDNKGIIIGVYRKQTEASTIIHLTSNHPLEHKISAFLYYINRLITLAINESSKQRDWETLLAIARNNGYPIIMINNLKTKLINRERKKQNNKNKKQRHHEING